MITGRKKQTFSLRARLTLLLALAVLVVFGAAAKIVDWRADTEMQQRFDASLLSRAQSLAALTQIENGRIAVDADNAEANVFPGNADTSWYELRCGDNVVARTSEVPPSMAAGVQPVFADAELPGGRSLRVVAVRFAPAAEGHRVAAPGAPACQLRYALDRGPLDDLLGTLDIILLGSLLGACVLVMLVTPWLVRRGLRPLAVLDRAMAEIGPDAPGGRLPASGTTELAPLVARINEVLARMDAGLARERQFASGLAHEFRTRLAELRTLVDVETRYPSGRDAHSLLGEVGSIGAELEATVTALLQLTRIQSGLEQSRSERVPLSPLLARVCARRQDAARARGVRIESDPACKRDFAVEADPALLEIVLDNLLGNAVAYVPAGGVVGLRASEWGIEVCNAAPALHAGDLANFGQRFWRKGAQGAGHAGLGLALAAAAARVLKMALSYALEDGVLRVTLSWGADADSRIARAPG
ncbi:MAG: sensor histidine kinase N-terminal domain-containing protein [Xanthomonadaceae bacterium]|nr:sensor histidine kinase N-terminal domain-containing protein [Xanthomonadaceae bacterium]MDE2053842.1 sensor histidine kinase N-terminal domain-containing protein [Xanthomonadaceae bacterium]